MSIGAVFVLGFELFLFNWFCLFLAFLAVLRLRSICACYEEFYNI